MSKKTAIEELVDYLENKHGDILFQFPNLLSNIDSFLALEKQQIIDAANNGCKSMCNIDTERDGEDYYTQTYKD